MTDAADLDPEHGEPMPRAIAITAHEYVHYLHNMSTLAGQQFLFFNLVILLSMVHGSDDQGRFRGLDTLRDEEREMVLAIRRWMDACGGACDFQALGGRGTVERWDFGAPQIERESDPVLGRFGQYQRVFIPISVQRSGRAPNAARVAIGYSMITEGVAYEIDREIRLLQGNPALTVDEGVPALPYLAFQPLVDHLIGRKTTAMERVQIGAAALMCAMPGQGLITACKAIKEGSGSVADVVLPIIEAGAAESDFVISNLEDTIARSGAAPPLLAALTEYIDLLKRASELRRRHAFIEAAFIADEDALTVERLRALQGQMLDCCVLQKKPGGKLDHYWLGPGHIRYEVQDSGALSLLQAAFHYTHVHFLPKGQMISTAEITRQSSCPYQGACRAEDASLKPNPCLTAPWERFPNTKVGDDTCWYKAGVLVLAGDQYDPSVISKYPASVVQRSHS